MYPSTSIRYGRVGELDDIGRTGDKIQDIIKRTLKIDKSEAGSGVKISGAVKEVIEDIKAVGEKVSKALDDVVEGMDKTKYTDKIMWGIQEIEVRPEGKGFWGRRVKQKSFYHVNDMPEFAKIKVLKEAERQIAAADMAKYKVEWLVSDKKAVEQLTILFKEKNIDIKVTYYPE